MELIGRQHNELLNWLIDEWIPKGPPICVLVGAPGVGKTTLAEHLADAVLESLTVVQCDMPMHEAGWEGAAFDTIREAVGAQADDRLELPAKKDSIHSPTKPANRRPKSRRRFNAESMQDWLRYIEELLQKPIVLIADEFQRGLDPRGNLPKLFLDVIRKIALQPGPGRLLLVANRRPIESGWGSRQRAVKIQDLGTFTADEARACLDYMLRESEEDHHPINLPEERRDQVVEWLGRNPKGLRALIACLRLDVPIEKLVDLDAPRWKSDDQHVAEELLFALETELYRQALNRFRRDNISVYNFLLRIAVYRMPVPDQALLAGGLEPAHANKMLMELSRRFLVKLRNDRMSLMPTLRAVALQRLKKDLIEFGQAHRDAASFFERILKTCGNAFVGSSYAEARFHLTCASEIQLVDKLTRMFAPDFRRRFQPDMSLPKNEFERDELILGLSAFIDEIKNVGWELRYLLVRLLLDRDDKSDYEFAHKLAVEAAEENPTARTWRLAADVKLRARSADDAVAWLRKGIGTSEDDSLVGRDNNIVFLFLSLAKILEKAGRADEAIMELRQGIGEQSGRTTVMDDQRAHVYRAAANIYARDARPDEGIRLLLERGIGPAGKAGTVPIRHKYSLYRCAARIAACEAVGGHPDLERTLHYVDLGRRLASPKQRVDLILVAARAFERSGQVDQAVQYLRQGIEHVAPEEAAKLFTLWGHLHWQMGASESAVSVLQKGLTEVSADRGRGEIAEATALIAAASRRPDILSELATPKTPEDVRKPPRVLADSLRHQLRGDWLGARHILRTARHEDLQPLRYALLDALCCVAVGEEEEAYQLVYERREVLSQMPSGAQAWLPALLATRLQRNSDAARFWTIFRHGRTSEPLQAPSKREVLMAWDESLTSDQLHPAYNLPLLPPRLTGLNDVVSRPDGKPALSKHLAMIDDELQEFPRLDDLEGRSCEELTSILETSLKALAKVGFKIPFHRKQFSDMSREGQAAEVTLLEYCFWRHGRQLKKFHDIRRESRTLTSELKSEMLRLFGRNSLAKTIGMSGGWVSSHSQVRRYVEGLLPDYRTPPPTAPTEEGSPLDNIVAKEAEESRKKAKKLLMAKKELFTPDKLAFFLERVEKGELDENFVRRTIRDAESTQ